MLLKLAKVQPVFRRKTDIPALGVPPMSPTMRGTSFGSTLNQAYRPFSCANRLVIMTTASHLFEDPGTLKEVAERVIIWLLQHFPPAQYEGTGAQTKEGLR